MPKIIETVKKKIYTITCFRRKRYLRSLNRKLNNKNPSIIASDCIGGIVYHDLNLKFRSPTINLWFTDQDFITFLEHLEDFLKAPLKEKKSEGYNYPVGELEYNDLKVSLYFMHYKTFDEALTKWEDRKNRINLNNLFIIWHVPNKNGPSEELLNRFLNLNFKNKVLITGQDCLARNKEIFKLKLYGEKYFIGKILEYRKELLSIKRYLNKWDYVAFLNSGKIKKAFYL